MAWLLVGGGAPSAMVRELDAVTSKTTKAKLIYARPIYVHNFTTVPLKMTKKGINSSNEKIMVNNEEKIMTTTCGKLGQYYFRSIFNSTTIWVKIDGKKFTLGVEKIKDNTIGKIRVLFSNGHEINIKPVTIGAALSFDQLDNTTHIEINFLTK